MTNPMETPFGRLLLVEDDVGLARLISASLEEAGYACAAVNCGRDALESMASNQYDLALLDYALPDMKAGELVASARKRGNLPPFLVLSGNGDERVAVELMKSGARDYLVKDSSLLHRLLNVVTRILEEIQTKRQLEEKLERTQAELMHTSRLAGMAEVATSVLHNVGNVLNSINISITLASDQVKQSKIANLGRAAALMRAHSSDLAEFLTHDPKGQMLPGYLEQLADYLAREQTMLLEELGNIRTNVEHIRDIVATHQSSARTAGTIELVRISELVEDALRMNLTSLQRDSVRIVREYDADHLPVVAIAKHKALQILVNLIRNAKSACDESGRPDKCLTIRATNGGDTLKISVIDNGVGIAPENMPLLFTRGFTTKKDGHGFGLHTSLLAAKELGASLRAASEGPGRGAMFTLELPTTTKDN